MPGCRAAADFASTLRLAADAPNRAAGQTPIIDEGWVLE
jgi:hypothetical protein